MTEIRLTDVDLQVDGRTASWHARCVETDGVIGSAQLSVQMDELVLDIDLGPSPEFEILDEAQRAGWQHAHDRAHAAEEELGSALRLVDELRGALTEWINAGAQQAEEIERWKREALRHAENYERQFYAALEAEDRVGQAEAQVATLAEELAHTTAELEQRLHEATEGAPEGEDEPVAFLPRVMLSGSPIDTLLVAGMQESLTRRVA